MKRKIENKRNLFIKKPSPPLGQSAFGQSEVYFMIDRIFSVDHAFGRLELYVFGQD